MWFVCYAKYRSYVHECRYQVVMLFEDGHCRALLELVRAHLLPRLVDWFSHQGVRGFRMMSVYSVCSALGEPFSQSKSSTSSLYARTICKDDYDAGPTVFS